MGKPEHNRDDHEREHDQQPGACVPPVVIPLEKLAEAIEELTSFLAEERPSLNLATKEDLAGTELRLATLIKGNGNESLLQRATKDLRESNDQLRAAVAMALSGQSTK